MGGEEQQIRVCCCPDEVDEGVLVLEFGAGDASPAAALCLELFCHDRLHITGGAHGDHQRVVIDQILDIEFAWIDFEC